MTTVSENTLERIHNSALKFLVPLGVREVYKIIIDEAIKLVSAQYGSLLIEEQGELVRVFTTLPQSIALKLKPRKEGFTYICFKKQKALVKKSREYSNTKGVWKAGLLSNIFIPLAYKGKSIGVLVVNSFENVNFTNKEMEILKLYGSLASLAIRKAHLHEETTKALEARDIFISMAGHELKTPLTTIRGYIQLLESKFKDRNVPEKKWIDELSWQSYRLFLLINELLAVNKVSIGELNYHFRVCDLKEILEKALSNFRFSHLHHVIEFKFPKPDDKYNVIGDFDKLLQAIDNILDNAAKFSPAGSKVLVITRMERKMVVIEVQDQGRGIEEKDLPKLFENYYRGSNKDAAEGMGIGLYLTKNIIIRHRGTIKIKSKPRLGTKVTIKLPFTKI